MQTLIPHILRCDVEKVKSVLSFIEQETGKAKFIPGCWLSPQIQ